MTKQHHEEFHVGDRVRVSNGQPKPPAHHNRKLAKWENANYSGTVTEVHGPFLNQRTGEVVGAPNGWLQMTDDDYPDSWICIRHSVTLGEGDVVVERIDEKVVA